MPTSRREFLLSASALAALTACRGNEGALVVSAGTAPNTDGETGLIDTATPGGTTPPTTTWSGEPGPEPDPWIAPGTLDYTSFAWGVQSGDATETSVMLSIRHLEAELELVVMRGTEAGWEEVVRYPGILPDDDVSQLELIDLVPDTTYSVAFYAPDGERRSRVGRFRTALYPAAQRIVRFGATSCLGGNEPWRNLTRASEERLDFFLLLGDTVYADAGWGGDGEFEDEWRAALRVAGLNDLTASTSVVATWDDHEVDNNWSYNDSGMPQLAYDGMAAMKRALPMREGPDGSGLWRRLAWGDAVDLFVLDCRGERLAGDYISPTQMDWLKDGLSTSTARFKVILNSVPITDMDTVYFGISAEDRWDGHPAQRTEILEHIRDDAIPGVLWVGGDFHWGAITRIGRPGRLANDQWEVFAGPSGSPINPVSWLVDTGGGQFDAAISQHNYVLFEADPAAGTIRVMFVSDGGGTLVERVLTL